MDFRFSEEQDELRQQARAYLDRRLPPSALGATIDKEPGWDPSTWREIADLGWLGVSIPEERGGAGLSYLEEAILIEEFGRRLYSGPYLAAVGLALPAIPEGQLADFAQGHLRWSVCDDAGSALVPNLRDVDRVVVVGEDEVFAVAAEGQPLASIDASRPMGRLDVGPDRELLASGARAVELTRGLRLRKLSALALEAVGLAQQVLEWGVEHARTREQFEKKIGSYQAVSHPLVNSFVEIELARSLAYWAAWLLSEGDEDPVAAPAAYAAAAEAAVSTCERVIQVHGGMGFTWDSPLHRYYKRALWIQHFGGPPDLHRARVARQLIVSSGPAASRSASGSAEGGSRPWA
jgi:alkylation response protein AidB-like acyl-CoA dehydrogenase